MENRRKKNGGVVRENHPKLGETSAMEHVGFPVVNRKKMFRLLHWEYHVVGGWALPLWKMMEFVSWDDDILNIWKNISAMFQTTNQIMDYPIPKFFGSVNRFFSFFNIDD